MRVAVADHLEAFVERDGLADATVLAGLVAYLEEETGRTGDPDSARLASVLQALLPPLIGDGVDARAAHEVEAVVYPRLWKIMEAIRSGLPAAEIRTRIDALGRRLSGRLVQEPAW